MKRVIFMGTPEFSVNPLKSLNESKDIKVELVITGKDKKRSRNKFESTPVKKEAIKLNLDVYTPDDVNSKESLEVINKINPDYIVVVAFGQMIKSELLDRYNDRIINIHSSLLPKYRGAAPMQWAILNKEKKTGVCTMLIEKTMDTGDVLQCYEMSLSKNDDIEYVHDKLSELSKNLIVETILNYDELYKNRTKQKNEEATYSKKITKEMGHLDFNEKAEDINAKIMAFSNWPSTYIIYKDEKVKIHKINIIEKYTEDEIGKIFKINDEGIFVNCLDKCIILKEIQFPNKKSMDVKTFLMGNSIELGVVLK